MLAQKIIKTLYAPLLSLLVLEGCATSSMTDSNDPFEPTNRAIFGFNQAIDHAIERPIAKAYVAVAPEPVRTGIHNILANFFLPVTFANDILQAQVTRGAETLARFVVNSTLGLAGTLDIAQTWGIEPHTEDFGQTLAVWGLGDGPYLVLPLLGPSGPRDALGNVADIFIHPFTYVGLREKDLWTLGIGAVGALDLRARNLDSIDDVEESSVDPYAAIRSLYRQYRDNEIRNGEPSQDLPEF